MHWLTELFNVLQDSEEKINGTVCVTVNTGKNYIQLNTYWSEKFEMDFHKRIYLTDISFAKIEVEALFESFIKECNEHYRIKMLPHR